MSNMSRGEMQDLLNRFATENPKYRQALLANPKAMIERQLNTSLGNVLVKAIAETADTVYVIVPYAPVSREVSDGDFDTEAAGFGFTDLVKLDNHVGSERDAADMHGDRAAA
jgi:hypothetical protein